MIGVLFSLVLLTFQCDLICGDDQNKFDPICTNGTPVAEKADAENTEKCSACDSGYWLDDNDMTCKKIDSVWTVQASGTQRNFNDITYANGKFVAVGDSGRILTAR